MRRASRSWVDKLPSTLTRRRRDAEKCFSKRNSVPLCRSEHRTRAGRRREGSDIASGFLGAVVLAKVASRTTGCRHGTGDDVLPACSRVSTAAAEHRRHPSAETLRVARTSCPDVVSVRGARAVGPGVSEGDSRCAARAIQRTRDGSPYRALPVFIVSGCRHAT